MQAGIDIAYPSYQPQGYEIKGLISNKDGAVAIAYNNKSGEYHVNQQKSSWDSVAVISNYIKPNWGDNYTIIKDHGLLIYVNEGKAAWVNGGIFYTIDGSAPLTDAQLRDIAISL